MDRLVSQRSSKHMDHLVMNYLWVFRLLVIISSSLGPPMEMGSSFLPSHLLDLLFPLLPNSITQVQQRSCPNLIAISVESIRIIQDKSTHSAVAQTTGVPSEMVSKLIVHIHLVILFLSWSKEETTLPTTASMLLVAALLKIDGTLYKDSWNLSFLIISLTSTISSYCISILTNVQTSVLQNIRFARKADNLKFSACNVCRINIGLWTSWDNRKFW